MRFEFATAGRVVFGAGTIDELPAITRSLGRRALLVTGRVADRARPVARSLEGAGVSVVPVAVGSEPDVALVEETVRLARGAQTDVVVAVGGGSVIDAAKATAALLTNGGCLLDYLEVVGRGAHLAHVPAPCVAAPTTAGTGAEVTRNAVVAVPAQGAKASLRHLSLLPRAAIVDPRLTLDLPPALTASTGLDALTQLLEPFVCTRANPLTDAWCLEGMSRVARSLRRAWADGGDLDARGDMAFASLLGGLALANAGLGAVHGFAAALGGAFHAPHGAVCAALLPSVTRANIAALRRQGEGEALCRYDQVARLLTGRPSARAEDGADWLLGFVTDLGIPRLRAYGVTSDEIPAVVERAARASSMRGNPVALTAVEMRAILEASC